jgi:hypothetical protein
MKRSETHVIEGEPDEALQRSRYGQRRKSSSGKK